mmetsp:Transcript_45188/g.125316  ORF Transcript_45188/g.125316 Transcript_45188/m.125316 type:complete len:110 (-) Transcript_45188:259-588(-)|eukprot:6579306-Prymnesium_polylepis.1
MRSPEESLAAHTVWAREVAWVASGGYVKATPARRGSGGAGRRSPQGGVGVRSYALGLYPHATRRGLSSGREPRQNTNNKSVLLRARGKFAAGCKNRGPCVELRGTDNAA